MFFLGCSFSQNVLTKAILTLRALAPLDCDEGAGPCIAVPSVAFRFAGLSYSGDVEADAAELAEALGVAHDGNALTDIVKY
jgi:hypothetical protein